MEKLLALIISSGFSIMVMIGGILLISCCRNREGKKLEKYRYKTTAKIVRAYDSISNRYQDTIVDGTGAYSPVYEYYYGGQYYTTVSRFGSSDPKFTVGSSVTIYINPQNPNDIYEPGVGKIVSKIGIIFGVIFILFAAIPLLTNIVKIFFDGIQSGYFSGLMVKMLVELLVLAGIIALFVFLYKIIEKKKRVCTQKVEATVVDIKISIGSKGSRVYSPVFEYRVNGITYRKQSSIATNWRSMAIGSTYNSLYVNPHNPLEIYESVGMTAIIIFAAIVLGILSLAILAVMFNDVALLIEEFNSI